MSQLGLGTTQAPQTRDAHRASQRRRRHRGVLAAIFALVIVVGVVGGIAFLGRSWLSNLHAPKVEDYPGPGSGSVHVRVAPGDSLSVIGQTLDAADVVASSEAFVHAANDNPAATSIQPGTYDMRQQMSAAGAVDLLLEPSARVVNEVVLPEGLRLSESYARLAEATGLSEGDLTAAAKDPAAIGLPAYAGGNLEGFVFPATYDFQPDATATQVLSATVARFNQAAVSVGLDDGAKRLGISPYQAVIVASLVEAEASRSEDYPRVARVIYNRLAIGMRLQLDSTVHYAVGESGSVFTSDADRAVDSPYNTYRVKGLPPGPINSPGELALEAALNPAAGDWLYFVTVNLDTGDTRFATTGEQHAANVLLLTEYCKTSDRC